MTKTTTIREMVRSIQRELRDTPDLQPDRAAEMLTQLSALFGNILDELREADLEYKRVLLACMRSNEAANRAKIEAETSPEYVRRQESQNLKDLAKEMTGSLKYYLRAKEDEWRTAHHQ